MADEKEIKNEELTDEQANCASGGSVARPRTTVGKLKQCSGTGCKNPIPDLPGATDYCVACQRKYGIQILL